MSVRISQRLGRNSAVTMSPLGWMVWAVLVMPFMLMVWAVKGVVYTVRQIAKAIQDERRRRLLRATGEDG